MTLHAAQGASSWESTKSLEGASPQAPAEGTKTAGKSAPAQERLLCVWAAPQATKCLRATCSTRAMAGHWDT